MGKVIGSICANGHERIGHREAQCPLCATRNEAERLGTENEKLADEMHYLRGENESLRSNSDQDK